MRDEEIVRVKLTYKDGTSEIFGEIEGLMVEIRSKIESE